MTRNILNHSGEIVGELTLPDETTEEQWTDALAPYAAAPVQPTLQQIITRKIQTSIEFGEQIVLEATVGNVAMGITQAGKTKQASDFLARLQRYLKQGSLYAACEEIDTLIANGIPEELSPFITNERLTDTKLRIQKFLGI